MNASKNAVIYCRISRDAEGDGEGVERQERLCRDLAERLGLEVLDVYVDNDIGASDRTSSSKQRVAYEQMMEVAQAGAFQHLIAYSNSRLTRRMLELEALIRLHEEAGVVIHTVASGDDDLSTSDGRMVARIKASVDAAESDRIAERQRAAFLHTALKGEPKLQRQRPFGWEADGVTIRESEAALVREAVERLKQGDSITSIRREWERAGVKTAAGSDRWEWQPLHKVLLGWRTAGVRTYHREPLRDEAGKLVMGTWEPIISLEDRATALTMLKQRSIKKVRQGKWQLSGLVRCGVCGGKMYGQLTGTPTYACKPGSGHNSITAELLEAHVTMEVFKHGLERYYAKEAALKKGDAPAPPQEWPRQAELDKANEQIEELMSAFDEGALSGEIVFPRVAKLDQLRQRLRNERDEHEALRAQPVELSLHEASVDLVTYGVPLIGPDDTPAEEARKQRFLRREIEAVTVKKGKRGRAGWGKAVFERIEILWREDA